MPHLVKVPKTSYRLSFCLGCKVCQRPSRVSPVSSTSELTCHKKQWNPFEGWALDFVLGDPACVQHAVLIQQHLTKLNLGTSSKLALPFKPDTPGFKPLSPGFCTSRRRGCSTVLVLSLRCWQNFRVNKNDSSALEPILPNLSFISDLSFPFFILPFGVQ